MSSFLPLPPPPNCCLSYGSQAQNSYFCRRRILSRSTAEIKFIWSTIGNLMALPPASLILMHKEQQHTRLEKKERMKSKEEEKFSLLIVGCLFALVCHRMHGPCESGLCFYDSTMMRTSSMVTQKKNVLEFYTSEEEIRARSQVLEAVHVQFLISFSGQSMSSLWASPLSSPPAPACDYLSLKKKLNK